MGVIKDGTVSGNLPSAEVFAVHYPAYPSSLSRAVDTLGGIPAISKVRSSNVEKLELRFRPEDPCSHPAFGHKRPCNSLLLRISRNNTTGKNSHRQTGEGAPESTPETDEIMTENENSSGLSAEIVAQVRVAYEFTGMVDYQHVLPVHADVACRKGTSAAQLGESLENRDRDLGQADDENLMIYVPPLFSLKDIPESLVLRPSMTLSSKKKQEGVVQHRWETEIEPSLAIEFNIKEIPRKVIWKEHIPPESDQWKWQMAVSTLFDERPIWPKISISERLGSMGLDIGDHMLKRLLFRCAYYFGSGPFHRFWIRKGHDPRKDPDSRIYQRIDFRVPPSLRGYCDAGNGKKHKWEDYCAFRAFPFKCQTYLQLCELADDYIQQEIRKPQAQIVCDSSTGWFSSYALDNLRLRVAVRFLSIFPQDGSESLLKAVSERFEKSKKLRFHVNNLKPGEEGDTHNSQELIGEEDKADEEDEEEENEMEDEEEENEMEDEEEENEMEDEEEENEMEDEEIEEELHVDGPVYLGGEDADFALQSDSYLGRENVPRNYLQELLESLTSSEGPAGQLPGADSDGEYQIYEQNSDGNLSDDEY